MRGSSALVIWPKLPEPVNVELTPSKPVVSPDGTPAWKLLVRLNASPRTSKVVFSRRAKFLDREVSSCQKSGEITLYLPMLPRVPSAGKANAAGLIQQVGPGLGQSGSGRT